MTGAPVVIHPGRPLAALCAAPFWLSALGLVYPIGGAGRLWIGIHGLWNLVDRRRSPRDRRRLPVMAGFFVIGQKRSYYAQRLHFYFHLRYLKLFEPQHFVNVFHTSAPVSAKRKNQRSRAPSSALSVVFDYQPYITLCSGDESELRLMNSAERFWVKSLSFFTAIATLLTVES